MNETKELPINCDVEGDFSPNILLSTLRLFKALPIKNNKTKKPSKNMSEFTIKHGFMFSPKVIANFDEVELRATADIIDNEFGITPDQMNSSFHKSWKKVRDAPYMQLLAEQIFHYITTYGYESIGLYDEDTVFIPNERLDVPEIRDGGVRLFVVNGYTKSQLKEKILKLVNSGIATDNIDDITNIAKWVELSDDDVINIKNKEVRTKLYSHLDLIPENPAELLRLAVYETTDNTLLINSKDVTDMIRDSEKEGMKELFEQYDEHFGYKKLAQIYNRFKPLFLSFKSHDGMSSVINKISHLSKKYHIPMKPDLLNNITGMIKNGTPIYKSELDEELKKSNLWRKIRLVKSLKYRMTGNKNIVYRIRNGKSFATTTSFKNISDAQKIYDIIIDSISNDLKHLRGKEIYIPSYITYSLPTSAKQFTNYIPNGSYITVEKDMIFGIYWENQESYRIDLDLHAMALVAGHIGWNADNKSDNNTLMFTGDVTDAPKGASELLYLNKDYTDYLLVTLNYYNFNKDIPVPYSLIVAEEHPNAFERNYTINPNNIKCTVKSKTAVKQKVIGLAMAEKGECRFYFNETELGRTNVTGDKDYIDVTRKYIISSCKNQLTLNEMLDHVGAKIVTTKTNKSIDLSPQSLEKDTFINLLIKQ